MIPVPLILYERIPPFWRPLYHPVSLMKGAKR